MSSGPPSLRSSIQTCQVLTGDAERLQSARHQNPDHMICPPPMMRDQYGRPLNSSYGFNFSTAGCNSASERIAWENKHRPQYIHYVHGNPTQGSVPPSTQDTRLRSQRRQGARSMSAGGTGNPAVNKVMASCRSSSLRGLNAGK